MEAVVGCVATHRIEWLENTNPSLLKLPIPLFEMRKLIPRPLCGVTPIDRVFPFGDESMKGRKRPITHALHKLVLERVHMNVINTSFHIQFVANGVFKKTSLPDALFSSFRPARCHANTRSAAAEPLPGEDAFQPSPARRIVGVTSRQFPNSMQMIRQQHNRHNFKWAVFTNRIDCRSQGSSPSVGGQNWSSLVSHNREEERPSIIRSSVPAHSGDRTRFALISRTERSNCKQRKVRPDAPYGTGEDAFQPSPARRIVGVTSRQFPNSMQMIRQQHNCHNFKWAVFANLIDYRSQGSSPSVGGQNWSSLVSHNREEERPSIIRSSVPAHAGDRTRFALISRTERSNCKQRKVRPDAPYGTKTNIAVVLDKAGNYITGWKLKTGTPQFAKYIKDGFLK